MGSGILGIQFDANLMDGYQQGNISQVQFLKEQSSHGLVNRSAVVLATVLHIKRIIEYMLIGVYKYIWYLLE